MGRRARHLERALAFVSQSRVDSGAVDVLDRLDVRVDRVQAERGQRAVRARLARRELVRRKNLDEAMPCAPHPLGSRRQVRDLADAPVTPRPNREERKDDARLTTHAMGHLYSKWRQKSGAKRA